jgi:acetyl-CoA carboxylase biotin carboxyl carrier protein
MTIRTIDAFIPGIFYLTSSPENPPFKQPGDMVAAGDVVGLIEVMKSFMPVEAGEGGRLVRYLVESQDAVDAGQPLCEIDV